MNWEFIREIGRFRWAWRTFLRQFSKRVLRRGIPIVLPTGLPMYLPRVSKFATEVFITQCHVDWGAEEVFISHLDPSGVVLDIGANIGYYTLYTLPRVAAVHAFEPDPRPLAVLRQNLSPYPNAHIHAEAVGSRVGTVTFVCEDSAELSHIARSNDAGNNTRQVPMTTMDQAVKDLKLAVTGVKIDAEGADIEVIEGGIETLRNQSPLVLTEAFPEARLFDLIQPLGYRVFAFIRKPEGRDFSIHEIFAGDPRKTKMLFLVPPRLAGEFEKRVTLLPSA